MRRNVRIEARSSTGDPLSPITFDIYFSYPDRAKAQATVRELATRLAQEDLEENRERVITYNEFWGDLTAAHLAKAAPPPPPGDVVRILDPPSHPKESAGPNRLAFLAWGLAAGLLLGLLAALLIRWPRRVLRLAAFAVSGFIFAAAASFVFPNRYTATAVMEIRPAELTEDPLAPLPPVITAADFLRQCEPQVLSLQNLSRLIQDPRLNLYPEARASRSIEEVARQILANDIRIAPLNQTPGAFRISFTYPDRRKAQDMANTLITTFIQETTSRQREDAVHGNAIQREILSRRAGEYLDVLDPPITPQKPDSPNRRMIAIAGLAAGLLIGAITLRRRATPPLQPA